MHSNKSDIGYILVQYTPVIALVCGFLHLAMPQAKPQTRTITGAYCDIWLCYMQ